MKYIKMKGITRGSHCNILKYNLCNYMRVRQTKWQPWIKSEKLWKLPNYILCLLYRGMSFYPSFRMYFNLLALLVHTPLIMKRAPVFRTGSLAFVAFNLNKMG